MAADKAALILFRALPEFKASAPWIQDLAEAAFIRGMEEGKRQCGPSIPQGWKLVPAQVTETMLDEWFRTPDGDQNAGVTAFQPRWKAMIDASPSSDATGNETSKEVL